MNKLIIPSAGNSTRFYELGKSYPKSLLPYKNKPILLHILEPYLSRFDVISLVVKDNLSEYEQICNYYKFDNVEIKLVNKNLTQGPATSVFCGLNGEESEITIMLSDAIYNFDITNIAPDSISAMEVEDYKRWCMVDSKINFYDKPENKPPTNFALSGIYKFSNPKLFYDIAKKYIENTKEETQFAGILSSYNDKKSLKIFEHEIIDFLDFGTLENYISNKNVPISRKFNKLEFNKGVVKKKSISMPEKIISEALWMKHFPINQENIPRVYDIDYQNGSIDIEFISGFTLREIMMYYDNSREFWSNVFNSIHSFVINCKEFTFSSTEFWDSVIQKTILRSEKNEDEFIEYYKKLIFKSGFYNETTLFHGDLVFSNIIYDPVTKNLKFIDPNGRFFGHHVYDLCKMGQSIFGNYDLIDSEMYIFDDKFFKIFSTDRNYIEEEFFNIFSKEIELIGEKTFYAIVASLYLSLIPLHKHNKNNQNLYYEEYKKFYSLSREYE